MDNRLLEFYRQDNKPRMRRGRFHKRHLHHHLLLLLLLLLVAAVVALALALAAAAAVAVVVVFRRIHHCGCPNAIERRRSIA